MTLRYFKPHQVLDPIEVAPRFNLSRQEILQEEQDRTNQLEPFLQLFFVTAPSMIHPPALMHGRSSAQTLLLPTKFWAMPMIVPWQSLGTHQVWMILRRGDVLRPTRISNFTDRRRFRPKSNLQDESWRVQALSFMPHVPIARADHATRSQC